MTRIMRRTWVLVPLLTMAVSMSSYAQEASSFEQLQLLVKPGDKIYVRGAGGETIEGKVQELSTSTLSLNGKFGVRSLNQADISEIRKWRNDSLKNGLAIGTTVGALLGSTAFADKSASTGVKFAALGYTAGLGAAIGVGIDALIPHKAVVFRGENGKTGSLHFAPILSRDSKGAAVSLKF